MSYYDVLTDAINDMSVHGFDSFDRVEYWTEKLRQAALESMTTEAEVDDKVREFLIRIFGKMVINADILRYHPGVSKYTLQMIQPELHTELQSRINASADLIKLNRVQAMEQTLRRFQGWASSVPAGGSKVVDKREEKKKIKQPLASLPFTERRVAIDQGAKLFSSINTTIAVNGGAIGGFWQSHKHQPGYNGRPAHNKRDGTFFLIRDSWATKSGLVKKAKHDYTDEIEQPGEFVFCRCAYQYVYSLRSIPPDCLTKKGEEALAEARKKLQAARA